MKYTVYNEGEGAAVNQPDLRMKRGEYPVSLSWRSLSPFLSLVDPRPKGQSRKGILSQYLLPPVLTPLLHSFNIIKVCGLSRVKEDDTRGRMWFEGV